MLKQAGIEFVEFPDIDLEIADGVVRAHLTGQEFLSFEIIYSALGIVRSGLTVPLRALCSQAGCILVDAHQRTRDCAAGDVVHELSRISVAIGHAAIATTDIHDSLAEEPG